MTYTLGESSKIARSTSAVSVISLGQGGVGSSPTVIAVVSSFCSLLAQLVEQLTVNQFVAGSSPAQGAIYYGEVAERFNALVLKTSVGE